MATVIEQKLMVVVVEAVVNALKVEVEVEANALKVVVAEVVVLTLHLVEEAVVAIQEVAVAYSSYQLSISSRCNA